MMCPYLLISINELLISIIPFIDINKYGLNVKTAAHKSEVIYTGKERYKLCADKMCSGKNCHLKHLDGRPS